MSEENIFNTPNLLDEFYTLLLKYKNNKSISKTKLFKQEMFTNKAHYLIFKHLPKPSEILKTNSYIVLKYVRTRERFSHSYSYYTHYIVGINSDNKLFIIKPHRDAIYLEENELNDDKIRKWLLYDSELVDNTLIQNATIYRLQGDILGEIYFPDNLLEIYRRDIQANISLRITNILTEIIRDRIVDLLLELGLTPEVNRFTISIYCVPRKNNNASRLIQMLSEYIFKNLYINDLFNIKEFEKKEITKPSNFFDKHKIIKYYISNTFAESTLDIYIEESYRGRFQERFKPINIIPTVFNIHQLLEDITKNINPEVSKQRFTLGRHIIEYNGYPSGFSIMWKPSELEHERIINVDLHSRLYVKSGKLTIRHPEHGTVDINVPEDCTIRIFNIPLDLDYVERCNYYRVKDYLK